MKLAQLIGREIDPAWFDIPPSSSLDAWAEAANHLFAPGCEAQAFMLLASFAAPLMSLFKVKERGAVVSLYGQPKSGKTTALTAAATVWGHPKDYQIVRVPQAMGWGQIERFGNLPIVFEHVVNRDPANSRAFFDRFLQGVPGLDWSTVMLCASGVSLFSTIAAPDWPPVGVEMLVGVPRGLKQPQDRNRIAMALTANRGNPALPYLRHLAKPEVAHWLRGYLVSRYADLVEKHRLGDAWRYPMRTLAAVQAAGMLVNELGILGFEVDRIVRAAVEAALPPSRPGSRPGSRPPGRSAASAARSRRPAPASSTRSPASTAESTEV